MTEQNVMGLKSQNEELRNIIMELKEQMMTFNAIKQQINETDNRIIIESAKRETEIKALREEIEEVKKRSIHGSKGTNQEKIEIQVPIFYGGEHGIHPKQFIRDLEMYMERKEIPIEDEKFIISNSMKGNAASWFSMIRDAAPNMATFKPLFLKHFFSDKKQWDIFIQCTEAGKSPIESGFQTHFHKWMTELKYLDTPKITEEQGINLVVKHFPIAIQAFIQTSTEKRFLSIWEKLDELENYQIKPQNKNLQSHKFQRSNNFQQQGRIRQITVDESKQEGYDEELNSKNEFQGASEKIQPRQTKSQDHMESVE